MCAVVDLIQARMLDNKGSESSSLHSMTRVPLVQYFLPLSLTATCGDEFLRPSQGTLLYSAQFYAVPISGMIWLYTSSGSD